jgi:ATP-dependent helicase HrpB
MTPAFPITPLLPDIVASLADRPRLVLEAPPGAGKTTQVPLALLDAPGWRVAES